MVGVDFRGHNLRPYYLLGILEVIHNFKPPFFHCRHIIHCTAQPCTSCYIKFPTLSCTLFLQLYPACCLRFLNPEGLVVGKCIIRMTHIGSSFRSSFYACRPARAVRFAPCARSALLAKLETSSRLGMYVDPLKLSITAIFPVPFLPQVERFVVYCGNHPYEIFIIWR